MPPQSERKTLSTRTWRSKRQRPAPRATRIPISRSREAARASIIVVKFAHAIRSTRKTAASKIRSNGFIGPSTTSLSGKAVIPKLSSCG